MYVRKYETPEDSVHLAYLERTVNCEGLELVKKKIWDVPGGTPKEEAIQMVLDHGFTLLPYREYRVPKGERPRGTIIEVIEEEDWDRVFLEDPGCSTCAVLKSGVKVGTIAFAGDPSRLSHFSTRVPKTK